VHLVGFLYEIYHDARSHERQDTSLSLSLNIMYECMYQTDRLFQSE